MKTNARVIAFLCLLFAFGAQAALTDEEKCGAKKTRALFRYSQCLDRSYAHYFWALEWKSSRTVEAAWERVQKCHLRCSNSMASAEKKGLCANNTDSTNPAICGAGSLLDTQALCRHDKTRGGSCTYPPP